jgi:hypothetical protein
MTCAIPRISMAHYGANSGCAIQRCTYRKTMARRSPRQRFPIGRTFGARRPSDTVSCPLTTNPGNPRTVTAQRELRPLAVR